MGDREGERDRGERERMTKDEGGKQLSSESVIAGKIPVENIRFPPVKWAALEYANSAGDIRRLVQWKGAVSLHPLTSLT